MTVNKKQLEYAKKVREKGRIKYSLEQGLFFGILVFVFGNLFELSERSFQEVYFSSRGLLGFGFSLIFGCTIYASFMWWMNERTINKIEEKSE